MIDKAAEEMKWNTYRATLVRHGIWNTDLNAELAEPFKRTIARSWSRLFRTLSFSAFEKGVEGCVKALIQELHDSAAVGLQDRASVQGEACLEDVKTMLKECMYSLNNKMSTQQKMISRSLAPHIQKQLRDGYVKAVTECGKGKGSAQRRKTLFREYVDLNKVEIFVQGPDVIMKGVDQAAGSVGVMLDYALGDLAQKVEANLSTLWEVYQDDPAQIEARRKVSNLATHTREQANLWLEAGWLKKEKDKETCMSP
ncbi:hypothetical protein NMY22_g19965 [Coprinellus aureogranulatus]|nr:hypothetical protein NMY22_g19965 [Coprinellus aureogranulatus]